MTLKELLLVLDRDTVVAICDDFGMLHDEGLTVAQLPYIIVAGDQDRIVDKVYIDKNDGSLTIELEDWKDEN